MAQNNKKYAPTVNNFNTTLNGAISSSDTTINLNSVTGLQNKAGILVIDRVDTSGNLTPSKQEWIYFTGVSGSAVTLPNTNDGRGVAGSTAQSHSDGAIVEAVMDVSIWNGLLTSYDVQHTDAGVHTAFTTDTLGAGSNASIGGNLFANTLNITSSASISGQTFLQTLNIGSTASISGVLNTKNQSLLSVATFAATGVVLTPAWNAKIAADYLNTGALNSTVSTSENTASTTYTDLATAGPSVTVTIGANGLALVTISMHSTNTLADFTLASVVVSGANTISASTNEGVGSWGYKSAVAGQNDIEMSYTRLFTGLTAGSTTFKLQYRVASGTGSFARRTLSVIPL